MTNWQPIETAPKDETPILIYEPPIGLAGHTIYIAVWDWCEGKWIEAGGEHDESFEPTHWMPLPEPPRATAAASLNAGEGVER